MGPSTEPGPNAPTGTGARAAHPTDLARRISQRAGELGLSPEQVARRAGMDPAYLAYLEGSPDAVVTSSALFELSKVLDVLPSFLMGGEADRPPGRARANASPVVEVMDRAACERHLREGGVGRVVFVAARGPVAVPVNFRYHSGDVVFRTMAGAPVLHALGTVVGFEVDNIDDATSGGWSVLVTGTARRADARERATLVRLDFEPWAGGPRDTFVCIRVEDVTGRWVHARR